MAYVDLSLPELERYAPESTAPDDLADFWTATIGEAREHDLDLRSEQVPNRLSVIDTYDLTYAGFGGSDVRAWLHVPAGAEGPLPTVVHYLGYSGGRGFPHANTLWAQAGYAHLIMDTRGQGWTSGTMGGGPGGTPDATALAGLPHSPGFLTQGLDDPGHHYYRRVFTDAVRLLDVAAALPLTDADRLVVTGASQGGGISIATAGLAGLLGMPLRGAAPDVPFLCHFPRAVAVSDQRPYVEIAEFLAGWRDRADQAYRTLAYVDAVNLGRWASVPALFSVALMDAVCPPSTVYAALHAYGSESGARPATEIVVYPHNGHEGGGPYQLDRQLDWFAGLFEGQG